MAIYINNLLNSFIVLQLLYFSNVNLPKVVYNLVKFQVNIQTLIPIGEPKT